jgi:hypothetical protein
MDKRHLLGFGRRASVQLIGWLSMSEIDESNRQLHEAWKLYAQVSPTGEAFDRNGLTFANANQPWFFMNVAALQSPVVDECDLRLRAKEALEYFETGRNPWVLTGSENWFGRDVNSVLSDLGLVYKLDLMAMVAERLSPQTRPRPDVQLRRIDDERTRLALADLNAHSYHTVSQRSGDSPDYWVTLPMTSWKSSTRALAGRGW